MSEGNQESSAMRAGEYEKPEVESEEAFETLALTCSKADTQCFQPDGTPVMRS